jgi:hypothetical protein
MNLTKAQGEALQRIEFHTRHPIRFSTGEALRKAGLVTRETLHVVGRDYANQDGVWPQWQGATSLYHEWYLTNAGRACLRALKSKELSDG